jgi:hypothetical protein
MLVGSSPENGTSPMVYAVPALLVLLALLALLADWPVLLTDAVDVGLLLLQPAATVARAPTTAPSATRRIAVLIVYLSSTAVPAIPVTGI